MQPVKPKKLIIFTDSGDTIIDEATQVFDEKGIVTRADFIPGADAVLKELHDEGYRIALVADGEWDSFQNVYRENGLGYCFETWTVSERVGEQKPSFLMFDDAMEKMGLKEEDKPFIVMIGNNIKKDVAGANRYGLRSVWLDWSPRYFHEYEEAAWKPDHVVKTPRELKALIDRLEAEAENAEKIRQELKERCKDRLSRIVGSFKKILYEEDETFIKNMKDHNLAGDDIRKYRFWEWTQGVGLFGIWKLYKQEKKEEYLDILKAYYDQQLETGFPALNVNTVTPYLAMSFVAEETGEEKYMQPCLNAVKWIMESFPRTKEGGFQHMTSDSVNDQELWDDTLYMTVLFLANMCRITGDKAMKEEVEKQFLIHEKYLCDEKTGLWYHGWTFNGNHNFAGAFWGRGNSWVTMFIPELLEILDFDSVFKDKLLRAFRKQADTLAILQESDGMWHTLIDDPSSYTEASATSGFAYGLLKGVEKGFLEGFYEKTAGKAVKAILDRVTDEGIVEQVSYGTPMGRETKEFYKQIEIKPMPYGQAMAILLLMEYLRFC